MTAQASDIEPPPEDDDARERLDRALFDGWHAGDARAGNDLLDRYFGRLRVYFIARSQGEHEELVQETFARLLAKYEDYREGSFRAFLFGIANRVFLEFLRERYRRQNIEPWSDTFAEVSKGSSMSSRLAKREHHRLLLDALGRLPLGDQELLELYHWQRLPAREIGTIFNRPEGTIRSHLKAALKRLTALYRDLEGQSHGTEYSIDDVETWLRQLRSILARSSEAAGDPK